MPCQTCCHRKSDDVLCGSHALHGQKFCYFHTLNRHDAMYGARARRRRSSVRFAVPCPRSKTPASFRICSSN